MVNGTSLNTGREYLTMDEAATVLRVSRDTIYRLIRNGKLQSYRLEGRRLFARDDLDRYMDTVRV